MADDEKTDVTMSESAGSEREQAAQKATRKRVVKKKAPAAKPAKAKKKTALVSEELAEKDPSEASGVPLDKLLAGFLIVALVLCAYLFYSNSVLQKQMDDLKTAIISPSGPSSPATTAPTAPAITGEKAKLEFYVMSHCPYGIQVLTGIAPVLKSIGDYVDFRVNFIGSESNGVLSSMHGQTEVDDDLRELCAMKYYPGSYKFMDFVVCRSKNPQGTDWQSCASDNGMDAAKIKACAEGDEGKKLLSDSFKASANAKATGSPTMYLNGAAYNKGRAEADFKKAICSAMKSPPAACGNLPAPVKFQITLLNDKRCTKCDTTSLEQKLTELFSGATIKKLDYSSTEGKQLYDATGVQFLPAILFDDNVKKDDGYSQIQTYLVKAGTMSSLRIGSDWDPYCDPTTDHCSEAKCSGRMSCRSEMPKRIDLFVMSHCPYGIQALNAMKDVLATFKDMSFQVHYIGDYDNSTGKFQSLHGQTEVDDDLREICAMKYYPTGNKYMDFIWCRNNNITGDWQKCFSDNGMDAAKIKACAEGPEGTQLLSADMEIANQLSIGGSPTWLANNKNQFSGVTAEVVRANYCKYNPGLPGCEKTLSTDTGGVAATGGCG